LSFQRIRFELYKQNKIDVSFHNNTANLTINPEKLRIYDPEYNQQMLRDTNLVGFIIELSIICFLVFISIFQYIVNPKSCKIISTGDNKEKISGNNFIR